MTEEELTTRIETVLSSLHDDAQLSDAQIAEAIDHAAGVTGLTLPVTVAVEVEAMENRAKRFVFECLMSDWITRFDYSVGSTAVTSMSGEAYKRSQVFQFVQSEIKRLDSEYNSHLRACVTGVSKTVETRTAWRP